MALPVMVDEEVVAVLAFVSTTKVESSEQVITVLAHLGGLLGRVIERKRTEEQIRDLAYFDPLTGLSNRLLFSAVPRRSTRRREAIRAHDGAPLHRPRRIQDHQRHARTFDGGFRSMSGRRAILAVRTGQ